MQNDSSINKKKKHNKKEKVTQVCGGSFHILLLTQSKKVYCIRKNQNSQLSPGDNNNRCTSSQIDSKHFDYEKIIQIRTSGYYSMALTQNGSVYSWEYDLYSQLDCSDESNKDIPKKVDSIYFNNEPIKYIFTCSYSSFALTKNNNLYAWRDNCYGQLGLRNDHYISKPTLVDPATYNNEKIIKIECGDDHTLLLTQMSNGVTNIYSCGANVHGQLGLGHNDNKSTFQQVDPNHFANQRIRDIIASGNFSLALVDENNSNKTKIYVCGKDHHRQLNPHNEKDRNVPRKIDSLSSNGETIIGFNNGTHHSFVITKDSETNKTKVYAWGDNSEGQLGLGHFDQIKKPTLMNMVYFKEPITFIGANRGSYGRSYAITKTGKLFVWGYVHGYLGSNHPENVDIPQECCPELFGSENEKMCMNQSFRDVVFEFDKIK